LHVFRQRPESEETSFGGDIDETHHIRSRCIRRAAGGYRGGSPSSGGNLPAENQRCPSKWGANDERGSANHMKPASVLTAAKLIKTGEVIELGHVLGSTMPFFGTRRFDVHVKARS
jgi:hypothetical protein